MIYLQEYEFDMNDTSYLINFLKDFVSLNSIEWKHAMEAKIELIYQNDI